MKKCAKLEGWALRGRRRVDCEKMCEIKRVALRGGEGGLRKNVRNYEGQAEGGAKKCAKLRGSGRGWC